jgi:hypothetical protein
MKDTLMLRHAGCMVGLVEPPVMFVGLFDERSIRDILWIVVHCLVTDCCGTSQHTWLCVQDDTPSHMVSWSVHVALLTWIVHCYAEL